MLRKLNSHLGDLSNIFSSHCPSFLIPNLPFSLCLTTSHTWPCHSSWNNFEIFHFWNLKFWHPIHGPKNLLPFLLPPHVTPTVPSLTWYRLVPPWPVHPLPTNQHLPGKSDLLVPRASEMVPLPSRTPTLPSSNQLSISRVPRTSLLSTAREKYRITWMVPPWACCLSLPRDLTLLDSHSPES